MKTALIQISELADTIVSDLATSSGVAKVDIIAAIIEGFADIELTDEQKHSVTKRAALIRGSKRQWKRK
jgi:hypothetical protein